MSRRLMTAKEALALLQSLDEAESDGGAGSDSDVSWSIESASETDSESDSEIIPLRKKSRLDNSNSAVIPFTNPGNVNLSVSYVIGLRILVCYLDYRPSKY